MNELLLRRRVASAMEVPSALNYVQSGLVAMWDGIENAGIGVHDNNATSWADLSGNNRNWVLESDTSWDSNALVTSPESGYAAKCEDIIPLASNVTQEIVFELTDYILSSRVLFFKLGANSSGRLQRGLLYNRNNGKYGWMPKNNSVSRTTITEPTKNSIYRVVTIYNGTSNPTLFTVNNTTLSDWIQDGAGESTGYMWISCDSYGFYGKVYAIRIYDRALSSEEIAHNYNIDEKRFKISI